MANPRIYQNISLTVDADLSLDERATHYLANVLRIQKKDKIVLFNGKGGEYLAEIMAVNKKNINIKVISFSNIERELAANISLAQGIARGEKMDFIVQKSVELGVKNIYPLVTAFNNVHLNTARANKKLQHWQSVIVSATEQCGRNRLATIHTPQDLSAFLKSVESKNRFILSPYAEKKINSIELPKEDVMLLIGPEGGFAEKEVDLAQQFAFTAINLGPRILRTETAAIVALAIFGLAS